MTPTSPPSAGARRRSQSAFGYDAALDWLARKQREKLYAFMAEAPVRMIPPTEADRFGRNRSAVLEAGVRTFYFEDEADRDDFVATFQAVKKDWSTDDNGA